MPKNNALKWEFNKNVRSSNDLKFENLLHAYSLDGDNSSCATNRSHANKPCKFNPMCISGLGAKKWSNTENKDKKNVDPLRSPDEFVGLINPGQLCYANVFFQLWYHTKAFRYDIYKCDTQSEDNITCNTLDYTPTSKIGMLQMLFAEMEFGRASTVDPIQITEGLKLQANVQQDAHEFSTLFCASPSELKNIVAKHFHGIMEHRTRCHQCNQQRSTPAEFVNLSLNVLDGETVESGLKRYFAEEIMEGDNMYECQECREKTNATKSAKLTTLPPVMMLQIVRLDYNKEKQIRKKIRATIRIPNELNIAEYCDTESRKHHEYRLKAIICHFGSSTHSGHYVANIKNESNEKWHVFNDHQVTANVNANKTQLVDGTARKIKPEGGQILSNSCYMLVYESKNLEPVDTSIPEWLQTIMQCRQQIQEELHNKDVVKVNEAYEQWHRQKDYMDSKLEIALAGNPQDGDLISLDWLSKWAQNPDTPGRINHQDLLCRHNHLHQLCYANVRCISQELADHLYEKYEGGPRLRVEDSLCRECVYAICVACNEKLEIDNDVKQLQKMVQSKRGKGQIVEDIEGFWVGKESYRLWMKLAKSAADIKLEKEMGPVKMIESVTGNNESETDDSEDKQKNGSQSGQQKRSASDMEDHDEDEPPVKSPHGETYCNGEITNGLEIAGPSHDRGEPMEGVEEQAVMKTEEAVNDTEQMSQDAPSNGEASQATTSTVNSTPAVVQIGKIIDNIKVFNEDLLCPHENLTANDKNYKLVPEAAWGILSSYFKDARTFSSKAETCPICLEQVNEYSDLQHSNAKAAQDMKAVLPNFCKQKSNYLNNPPASHLYMLSRHASDLIKNFLKLPLKVEPPKSIDNSVLLCEHGKLHVDVATNANYLPTDYDDMYVLMVANEWKILEERIGTDKAITVTFTDGQVVTDPEICEQCLLGRRDILLYSYVDVQMIVRRASEPTREPSPPITTGRPNRTRHLTSETQHSAREEARSLRRRKQKDDFNIEVSATDTLHEIKVKIINRLPEPKCASDIHLSVDGRALEGRDLTLRDLNVLQDDILILREDGNDYDELESTPSSPRDPQRVEPGFEGTRLLDKK